jgi:hypothetical protein
MSTPICYQIRINEHLGEEWTEWFSPLVIIFGEELWWRGYIVPRQEQARGRWTWAIHGMLWFLWQALALLPICLAVPYVAQRRQNTGTIIVFTYSSHATRPTSCH